MSEELKFEFILSKIFIEVLIVYGDTKINRISSLLLKICALFQCYHHQNMKNQGKQGRELTSPGGLSVW